MRQHEPRRAIMAAPGSCDGRCRARTGRPRSRRRCSPRCDRASPRARARTSVSQSASSVGFASSMKSCTAPERTTFATAAGRRISFSMMATCRCTSATRGRGQPERRTPQQCRPAARRRQAGTRTALHAQPSTCPRRRSAGQRAAAEHQHFGQREHRPGTRSASCDEHPADRAAPPPFDRQLVGDRLEVGVGGGARRRLAAVAQRAEPALAAGDGVGNRVAIGVAQRERVQQRHAERERVALVRGQPRRLEDALEVEAAQRERRERRCRGRAASR